MANLPVQTTSPINWQTPIVNPDGTMTEPFRRLLQALKTNSGDSNDVVQQLVDAQLQAGLGIEITPDGHLLSDPTIAANIQTLLDSISDTQGDILYRSGSAWTFLPAGTSGQFLKTNGAGADPEWDTPAGGGSSWTLAGSWTYSSAVANVDFTGLGGYTEYLLIARNITKSVSGRLGAAVSVDGGASYYTASGDYQAILNTGVASNTTQFRFHETGATAARSGIVQIFDNVAGVPPANISPDGNRILFVASSSKINAIRVNNMDAVGNLTGGNLWCLAR